MAKMKLTRAANRERAYAVYDGLAACYPDVRCTLDYHSPLELLIMTILAAQCTDARVNIVAKDLFKKYRNAADFSSAALEDLQEAIRTCGFFRQKAKSIQRTCRHIVEEHGGEVPATMEALTSLPGVGRKTANVLLGECFDHQGVTGWSQPRLEVWSDPSWVGEEDVRRTIRRTVLTTPATDTVPTDPGD